MCIRDRYSTHIREMIYAFRKQGHEVDSLIMGNKDSNDSTNNQIEKSVKGKGGIFNWVKKNCPVLLWESLKDLNLLRFDRYAKQQLKERISSFKPDMIYERGNYLQLSGVSAANQNGIPHVLEMNAPYVEEKTILEGKSLLLNFAKNLQKKQCELTQRLVVVSSALKNHFVDNFSVSEEKILVTPNAVNLDYVKEISIQKKEEYKKKLNLNKVCLLYTSPSPRDRTRSRMPSSA